MSTAVLVAIIAAASVSGAPGDQEFSDAPLVWLLEQAPDWERASDPVSLAIRARLADREALLELGDDEWRALLRRSRAILVREKWPAGTPLAIGMRMPAWLAPAEIRLDPRHPHLNSAEVGSQGGHCALGAQILQCRALDQELGLLPGGSHTLTFDVTVELGRSTRARRSRPVGVVWQGSLSYDVQIVPTIDVAVPPRRGADLDAAIRASIHVGFRRPTQRSDEHVAYVSTCPNADVHPELRGLAMSVVVDLLRDGAVVETDWLVGYPRARDRTSVFWPCGCDPRQAVLTALPAEARHDPDELDRWSLRVRGVSDSVLGMWEGDVRWDGVLTIPVTDAIRKPR